ncbi:hypothetical protein B4U79_09647 [Dinothrombium tinctorium]|uniref:Uncharacterized protein n=1 Tax=Dinothrombium tinctorium TaxID=1965070 RepID=A0A3S3NNE0_9ACAR|nr:hypothetical protein B4U79_09647 [Dinothrombium tinctorium]
MRYFSSAELAELFEFSNSSFSKTYEHIAEIHGTNHNYSDYVSTHLDFVKHLHRVYNISDHNKMFSTQELPLEEEPEIMQHINQEVQGAEAVITQESRATKQILVETGEFRRPLQLNVLDRRNVKAIDNYVPLENPTPIIDLCDSSDECESDIFEKPVKLKDFEEEKENFEKVYKELGRNSKSVDDSSILEASIKTVSDIIERIDLSEKAASTKNISDLREKMEEDIKSECSKVLSDILEHSFLSESSEHSKNDEDNHSKEIFSHDSIEEDDEFESSKNVISDLLNLVSDISENNHSAEKANEANKHSDRQMSLEKESLEEDSFLESSKTVLSDILGKLDDSCDEKRSELIFEEKHGEDSSMINAESMNFDKFNDSDSYIIGCGQRKKNVLNSTILESSMSAISNILKVSETNESLEATRKIEDSSIISDEPRSQFSDKSKEEHSFSDEDEILGYDDSGRIDNIANISGNIRKWIEPCLESTRICTKKAKVAYFPSIDLSPNENTPEIDRWQKNTTRDSTKGMGITNENNHNMGTNVLSKFMQDEDLISKRENLPRTEKKRPVLTNLDKLRNLPRMRQSI